MLSELKVKIPKIFKVDTIHTFISEVIDEQLNPISENIVFDFCQLEFIEPSGVTIISNLIKWLEEKKANVTCLLPKNCSEPRSAVKYLDDSNFFRYFAEKNITTDAAVRSTTLPLEFLGYDFSYRWIEKNFIPWLSRYTNSDESVLSGIFTTSLGEIFNNIRDHSKNDTGCIFGQHYRESYKSKARIVICISDFGIGIPENIRTDFNIKNDSEAIKYALQEGVSTQSTPRNRGAGLSTILNNVVRNYKGILHIKSYFGTIIAEMNKLDEIGVKTYEEENIFPGTFIQMTIPTEEISNLVSEEEDDDEWFL